MPNKLDRIHCAILKNDDGESYINWIKACEIRGVKYDIISMFSDEWLDLLFRLITFDW